VRRLFLETASGRGRPGALLNRWRAGELEPAGEIRDDDQRDRDTDHPEQCAFHGFFSLELNLSGIRTRGPGAGSGRLQTLWKRRFPGLFAASREQVQTGLSLDDHGPWRWAKFLNASNALPLCGFMLRRKRHTMLHMRLSTGVEVQFRSTVT